MTKKTWIIGLIILATLLGRLIIGLRSEEKPTEPHSAKSEEGNGQIEDSLSEKEYNEIYIEWVATNKGRSFHHLVPLELSFDSDEEERWMAEFEDWCISRNYTAETCKRKIVLFQTIAKARIKQRELDEERKIQQERDMKEAERTRLGYGVDEKTEGVEAQPSCRECAH